MFGRQKRHDGQAQSGEWQQFGVPGNEMVPYGYNFDDKNDQDPSEAPRHTFGERVEGFLNKYIGGVVLPSVGVAIERQHLNHQIEPLRTAIQAGNGLDVRSAALAPGLDVVVSYNTLGYDPSSSERVQPFATFRKTGMMVQLPEPLPGGGQKIVEGAVVELPNVPSQTGRPVRALLASMQELPAPKAPGRLERAVNGLLGNSPIPEPKPTINVVNNVIQPGQKVVLRILEETPDGIALGQQIMLPPVGAISEVQAKSAIRAGQIITSPMQTKADKKMAHVSFKPVDEPIHRIVVIPESRRRRSNY